jgi:hypothetical protein
MAARLWMHRYVFGEIILFLYIAILKNNIECIAMYDF